MSRDDVPPEVQRAFGPLLQWIVSIAVEEALKQTRKSEGPRYYDAKNAPMGKTAFLRLAAQGAFPSFKVGKRVRARAEDVHAYIEAQGQTRSRPVRAPVAEPVDLDKLSPAEIVEMNLTRSLPTERNKRA